MVLPLLLIMILPKMMNDPETKKVGKDFFFFRALHFYPKVC